MRIEGMTIAPFMVVSFDVIGGGKGGSIGISLLESLSLLLGGCSPLPDYYTVVPTRIISHPLTTARQAERIARAYIAFHGCLTPGWVGTVVYLNFNPGRGWTRKRARVATEVFLLLNGVPQRPISSTGLTVMIQS